MAWWDFFRVFSYNFTDDPLSKQSRRDATGAGYTQDIPNIRADNDGSGSGSIRLRDTNDFIDLSTVTDRMHRYKEYERLLSLSEIDMAMTVFADEACFSGDTIMETPMGQITLKEAAETKKERFLCYAYDFEKGDYTLAWAFNPRKTKRAATIKVILDDGSHFICTPDHRILMKNETWLEAGKLSTGSELMPFYRLPANQDLTGIKTNQFPRIWTKLKGWIHERQFVDEWRTGKEVPELQTVNKYCRMVAQGLSVREMNKLTGNDFVTMHDRMQRQGFSNKELKYLGKKSDHRRVIGIAPHEEIDVYDVSVEGHKNFATNWGIAHNCQKDDDGRVFTIETKNTKVQEELEYLFFHRKMLNFDQKKCWSMAKRLFIMGDFFFEIVIDEHDPKQGILNVVPLPPDTMFRIETTKGKLVEFQQSKEGPDYQSLLKLDITQATDTELEQSNAIRFKPEQIVHIRIGDERKTFYPYGISLMEPARGPAHQLRLMEDAMVVYRLTRAPERRVFYIDTMGLSGGRAEALLERVKDQFRKKKVGGRGGGRSGASSVEERWHAPAADEDFWIPIRPNTNTRVETLPGAQNLGDIDDTIYFRNKLFSALNFPRAYYNNEDTQSTRVGLSALDAKFARLIERLQSHIEDALWDIADRHLRFLGYPEESYEDLVIKMTSPSDWRDLTRAEIINNRIAWATGLKGAQIMSDFDILTKWLKTPEEDAKEMLARLKIQKLEDLKLQIIAQNPALLGVGIPGANEQEVGTEVGGPNPMLGPPQGPPGGQPGMPGPMPPQGPPAAAPPPMGMRKYMDAEGEQQMPKPGSGVSIPEPHEDDIKRFDLDIKDYEKEIDEEEQDMSES